MNANHLTFIGLTNYDGPSMSEIMQAGGEPRRPTGFCRACRVYTRNASLSDCPVCNHSLYWMSLSDTGLEQKKIDWKCTREAK